MTADGTALPPSNSTANWSQLELITAVYCPTEQAPPFPFLSILAELQITSELFQVPRAFLICAAIVTAGETGFRSYFSCERVSYPQLLVKVDSSGE